MLIKRADEEIVAEIDDHLSSLLEASEKNRVRHTQHRPKSSSIDEVTSNGKVDNDDDGISVNYNFIYKKGSLIRTSLTPKIKTHSKIPGSSGR